MKLNNVNRHEIIYAVTRYAICDQAGKRLAAIKEVQDLVDKFIPQGYALNIYDGDIDVFMDKFNLLAEVQVAIGTITSWTPRAEYVSFILQLEEYIYRDFTEWLTCKFLEYGKCLTPQS